MKLKNNFLELDAQRKKIRAPFPKGDIGLANLSPREKLLEALSKGIEIELHEVNVGPGGLLVHHGEQVLLYIKDTNKSLWILHNEPENAPRFHIAECRTLADMRRKGRFERYVVTNRTDGVFLVDWQNWENWNEKGETEARLFVCMNCLKTLNWCGFADIYDDKQTKDKVWQSFSIPEFLRDYATFFRELPSQKDVTAKLNRYVKNWHKISENVRAEAGWQCAQCRVILKDQRRLLHVHHKSGVKTDNSSANLVVLCADCHTQQSDHQHMKISSEDRSKIIQFRVEQNLPIH